MKFYYLDGTTDGLNLLKDINEGDGSSDAGAPAVLGGNVFFIANDGVHGYELWKSDGTTGGTSLIKDINNSTGDPGIGDLYLHNDKLYFFAGVDGNNPLYSNLWESDGTEAGTGLVNNTQFLYSVYAPVGNSVVAVSDDFKSILKTDLTTKITSTLAGPLNNAITGGYPNHARSAGDNAYFYAQKGGPSQLFRANPTTDEFNVTKNIESGWGSTDSNIWEQSAVLNDKLIFKAQVTDSENEPWVTDGTDAGTFQLNDINPTGMSFSNYFTKVGDHVVFLAFSAEGNYGVLTGAHIWTTDGTVDGTKPLKECTVLPIGLLNDKAMFLVEPIVGQTSELWTTDGTQEGTSKFADAPYQGQAIISWMTTASKLYFVTESELWVTDGTPQGLKKVAPIDLGETWPGPYVSSGEMVVFHSNGKIYASLGAQETTTVIGNATPDSEMYIIDEHVYFLMKDPTYGRELFKIALPQNQAQTITFNSIEAQNLSDVTFTINATASSNLPVTFTSSDTGTGRITIAGNVATMTAAGKVTIVAHQDGDSGFYPAAGVSQIVCINPNAPTLTVSGTTVTSSVDNNQWFLNDQPTSLTGKTIRPTESGLYKAITSIDGCQSDASNAINLTILGLYDENNTSIKIFPNPAENKITITAQPQSNIRIMDVSGREQFNQLTTNKETLVDVTSFATGLYFVVIKDQQQAHHLRFIKR
ncbi:MAG: T9SS type A sorting domain-containing protein [Bacteroidota bacterium]